MISLFEGYFKAVKRFIPAQQPTPAVGLDIGAGECKLVEITRSNNGFELLNWAVEPVKDGDVRSAILNLLHQLETPCKAPYTAVFGKGTLIRYIGLPRMSLQDLRNSFSIEADKYFPFAQDQIYTDCYILDPQGKGKEMAVLAAAAKKEMVDQRIKLLSDLGLQADFIGINPVALANVVHVFGFGEEGKGPMVAIFDMGESVSNLTITIDRLPCFTRDIFIGGRDFTARLSNALGISLQEAERLKIQPGDRTEEIISASESALMSIAQELRLSFDYFTSEKGGEINKLLLTGGASKLEGIADALEKALDVKVSRWNPLVSLKTSSSLSRDDLDKKAFKLGVALGLALYHYQDD